MDRTCTLNQGFSHTILDPIPSSTPHNSTFDSLCNAIGQEIVAEAIETQREVHVMWSGGIDSTAALIAVLKAAVLRNCVERIQVLLTLDSIREYPRFFLQHVDGHLLIRRIRSPIAHYIDKRAFTVTGEHGDQLFGSHILRSYVQRGFGAVEYQDVLTPVLLERLKSIRAAHRVRRYFQPVIDAAPMPIRTLFDYFWWLNFALRWQEVSLRLCVFGGEDAALIQGATRHFFRDPRFQIWAINRHASRCPPSWDRYKDEAKRYIREFTGDDDYYRTKEKEDSLRNVMPRSDDGTQIGIFMGESFRPFMKSLDVASYA